MINGFEFIFYSFFPCYKPKFCMFSMQIDAANSNIQQNFTVIHYIISKQSYSLHYYTIILLICYKV